MTSLHKATILTHFSQLCLSVEQMCSQLQHSGSSFQIYFKTELSERITNLRVAFNGLDFLLLYRYICC